MRKTARAKTRAEDATDYTKEAEYSKEEASSLITREILFNKCPTTRELAVLTGYSYNTTYKRIRRLQRRVLHDVELVARHWIRV